MDPLSIVASVIAVYEAADRLAGLLSGIQPFLTAPTDVNDLSNGISNVKMALERLRSTGFASTCNPSSLSHLIATCLFQVSQLEDLVLKSSFNKTGANKFMMTSVNRLMWVRKRKKVEEMKQQLRDAMSAIQLEALSLNFSELASNTIPRSEHVTLTDEDRHPASNPSLGSTFTEAIPSFVYNNGNIKRTGNPTDVEFDASNSPIQPYCWHINHRGKDLIFDFLIGILSSLFLTFSGGHPFNDNCCHKICRKRPSSSLLFTHLGLYLNCDLQLGFQSSPFCLSLSFECVLPPDAEIFVRIRFGQLEELKSILAERRACVNVIMGPYRVTPLELAMFYRQWEICKFLLSAGVDRMSSRYSNCFGAELRKFWGNYSRLDYSISGSQIIRDYILQTSPDPHAEALSRGATELCQGHNSFTQLQKSVLGLTSQPLEDLLPAPLFVIEETDSLGRTALHLAAYTSNLHAIHVLISHNFDSNVRDYTGKTPLQVAATLGSVPATNALLAGGPDLELRDQFGNTVLHHVCIQGRVKIVELLLDAGADMEAKNELYETPLRHAVLGDHVDVLRFLHSRGAAFTPQDNINCNALSDALQFNASCCLRFLLGLQMRVDLKYFAGKTLLHILAECSDLQTMQIFLGMATTGLSRLNAADLDDKGHTALQYLILRRDAEQLQETFQALLSAIELARNPTARAPKTSGGLTGDIDDLDDNDEFSDAVEIQLNH